MVEQPGWGIVCVAEVGAVAEWGLGVLVHHSDLISRKNLLLTEYSWATFAPEPPAGFAETESHLQPCSAVPSVQSCLLLLYLSQTLTPNNPQ